MRSWGYEVTWESGDGDQDTPAAPQSYRQSIIDQDNAPVLGVILNFCMDTVCVTLQSDENGMIDFDGEQDAYHIQLLKVPEGCDFDPDFDLNTDRAYGE